jgi:hypothetical protein
MISGTRSLLARLALSAALFSTAVAKDKAGPDVLIVADNFGNDAEALRPSKDRPIYYLMLGGKQWDLGASVAGETMPPVSELEALIHRTLASQGFRQTQVGGAIPDIVVVYGYGSAYLEVDEWTEDSFDSESGEFLGGSTSSTVMNGREIFGLAGANKIKGKVLSSAVVDEITDAIESGRLYISISALDPQALREKKKRIVWRTRISIPTRRNRLPDAMEVMLASAAPYFGIDSDLPVVIGEDDRRKTDVQIGEATVVDEP